MGDISRELGEMGVLLTREARWFFVGLLPAGVVSWFEGNRSDVVRERRVDIYDVAAAHQGLGVKLRSSRIHDSKRLISVEKDVELMPGLLGHVEDWIKVSRPADNDVHASWEIGLEVVKDIRTRRYVLVDASDGQVGGCDIELVSVSAAGKSAWSVCFETFGAPNLREEALAAGVMGFSADTPLPSDIRFEPAQSWSYPEWIARTQSDPNWSTSQRPELQVG